MKVVFITVQSRSLLTDRKHPIMMSSFIVSTNRNRQDQSTNMNYYPSTSFAPTVPALRYKRRKPQSGHPEKKRTETTN